MLAALPAKQFYAILVRGILANTAASAAPPTFDLPVIRHKQCRQAAKAFARLLSCPFPRVAPAAARVALRA